MLVEGIGSGFSLFQNINHEYGYCSWLKKVHPEGSKEDRASKHTPKFERGEIFLPNEAPWLAELEKELFAFPAAKHDDQVDSISQYLTAADAMALQGRGGAVVRMR